MSTVIVKKYQKATCLWVGRLIYLASFIIPICAHAEYIYAQVTGFPALTLNVPASFNFLGIGDLQIKQTELGIDSGLTIGTDTLTFSPPGAGPWNPAWVAGQRDFYEVAFYDKDGSGDTVDYEFTFTGGLPTSSYLVFSDFDWGEQIWIKAYDAQNNLIAFNRLTFSQQNGNDPNGSTANYVSWTQEATYTGVIKGTVRQQRDNPVVSLRSSKKIYRLVYEVVMDAAQNIETNSIRFNFAGLINDTTGGAANHHCRFFGGCRY